MADSAPPPLGSASGLQLVSFFDPQAKTVARLHAPDKFDDDVLGRRRMARHTTGLGEIDAAMRGLDRLTQENAAMVEQSSAASARVAGEVETLRRRVAEFKLDAGLARAA